ncbi:MAG: IS21 family transposase, partial [Candidatus Riflebacteria bacterium]
QCFSYVLGYSRRQFIDFSTRHDFFTLIRRHQQAFDYFGGVPAECLYDNEKTVVLRWEAGKPVFNPAFTAFITHYNCRPIACRPGRPQTKGKVEAPFRYVEGNLLCGREFQEIHDLRVTARWWLENVSDLHIHDTTRRSPIELFNEEERSALEPLPTFPYDCSEVRLAVCNSEGLVTFETNHYSVPTGYIGDILSIKAGENDIKIYSHDLKLLAHHQRHLPGKNARVEDPAHHRIKREKYGLEPVREAFLSFGEAAEDYLAGLLSKNSRNISFHVRYILNLKTLFNSDDIHNAMIHAMRYSAYDAKSIERILSAKAQPRTLESIRNEKARETLEKALPSIKQREPGEYGELFQTKEKLNETDTNIDID